MEFTDEGVTIDKPLNDLDELVLDVVEILADVGVRYAVVSGYVVVLFGRARATEDIDVIVEPFDRDAAEEVSDTLRAAGYWGPAMPLEDLYGTLADDLPIRVAADGHRVPTVELKFANDAYDRASLDDALTVWLSGAPIRVGSIELQIAYKLSMGAQKDFEDALYLYEVAEGSLNRHALERYVEDLGVENQYDRLRSSRG